MHKIAGRLVVSVVGLIVLTGIVAGAAPTFDVVHEHTAHQASLTDIEFEDRHQIAFSLDEEGGFAAYVVGSDEVAFYHQFERRAHELAIGADAVYIAVSNTLWVYDIAEGNLSEHTKMDSHAAGMAYDGERNVIWVAGHETVTGYTADDGSEFMQFQPGHTDGIGAMAFHGDYIATGTQFAAEVTVYDIENEAVVYEPDLPDDVKGIGALDLTESGDVIVGTAAENDDVIAAFDIEEQKKLLQYRKHIFGVSHVQYVPSANVILSTGFDNTVKLYDVDQESIVAQHQHEDTIYTAALDLSNALLWIGDGEERTGTVSALDVAEDEPTPTPEPTTVEPTPSETPEPDTPTRVTTTEPPQDDETPATDAEGQPGFGIPIAIVTVLSAALLAYRIRD